jgi:hypothetical protein
MKDKKKKNRFLVSVHFFTFSAYVVWNTPFNIFSKSRVSNSPFSAIGDFNSSFKYSQSNRGKGWVAIEK